MEVVLQPCWNWQDSSPSCIPIQEHMPSILYIIYEILLAFYVVVNKNIVAVTVKL